MLVKHSAVYKKLPSGAMFWTSDWWWELRRGGASLTKLVSSMTWTLAAADTVPAALLTKHWYMPPAWRPTFLTSKPPSATVHLHYTLTTQRTMSTHSYIRLLVCVFSSTNWVSCCFNSRQFTTNSTSSIAICTDSVVSITIITPVICTKISSNVCILVTWDRYISNKQICNSTTHHVMCRMFLLKAFYGLSLLLEWHCWKTTKSIDQEDTSLTQVIHTRFNKPLSC